MRVSSIFTNLPYWADPVAVKAMAMESNQRKLEGDRICVRYATTPAAFATCIHWGKFTVEKLTNEAMRDDRAFQSRREFYGNWAIIEQPLCIPGKQNSPLSIKALWNSCLHWLSSFCLLRWRPIQLMMYHF